MAPASIFDAVENPSPVFPTLIPDQAYVIKDNVNYKLYYAGNDFGSINLATSSDGVNWTPYPGNPVLNETSAVQGEHADVHFYSDGFAGANSGTNPSSGTMNYRMWYQGAVAGIGGWRYAESPDGISWHNQIAVTQTGTPVFSGATGTDYGIADAVYTPGGEGGDPNKTFRIYANVQWELGPHSSDELVVMAYSPNGYVWTGYDPTGAGYATPVFAGTLDGTSFDTDHIGWFKVIKNSDTDWDAFYSGGKGTTYQALNGIGYANSHDGINWKRRKTIFTTSDGVAWRNNSTWMPSAVKTGINTYKIFFLGSNDPMTDGSWIWWKLGEADLVKDITPPTVASVDPAGASTNISPGRSINVTFSEEMDSTTITTSTFTLKKGATPVPGTVSYSGLKATFIPNTTLDSNSVYTAAITTGAEDAIGNALATDYIWNFTTGWNYHDWADQGVNYTAPSGSAYYPSVIYNANGFGAGTPEYAMWYSDGGGSAFLATSTNGVAWGTPTTMAGLVNIHHVQVLYDANCFGTLPCNAGTTKYRMWLWDMGAPTIYSISSMAAAESADGINWINQAAVTQNPAAKLVQDPDSGTGWNRGTYGPINVFYQPSATNAGTDPWNYKYVMYYDGTDGSHEDAGLAYSADGLYWNSYTANPVLSGSLTGGSESWDCASAAYGTILKDSSGYHFFFSGRGQDDGSGGCAFPASFNSIGYAFSTDGKTWVKDAKPIFQISDGVPYRSGRIYTPSVINDGSGILRMYFSVTDSSGTPKKIGYATMVAPAFLHVVKNVVNDNGGTAAASAFSLHVKSAGTDIVGSPAAGAASPGISYPLVAGAYIVSEDANASYAKSLSGDCNSGGSVTLSAGDDKTCTITNNDIAPASGGGGTGGGNNYFSSPLAASPAATISATPNPNPIAPAFPDGCTSTSGYSTATGLSCSTIIPPTPPVPPVCAPYITKPIQLGEANDYAEVRKLQTFLRDYEDFSNLGVTGVYDTTAYNAVKAFQLKYANDILAPWGMAAPSGYVYTTTIKKINELYCKGVSAVFSAAADMGCLPGNKFSATTGNMCASSVSVFAKQVLTIGTDLKKGDTNNNVTILQQFLISQNKGPSAQALARNGLTVYFGDLTRAALAEFQAQAGISPASGNFGPATRAYLSAHY